MLRYQLLEEYHTEVEMSTTFFEPVALHSFLYNGMMFLEKY